MYYMSSEKPPKNLVYQSELHFSVLVKISKGTPKFLKADEVHTQSRFDKISFLLRPQKTTHSSTDAIQQLLVIAQAAQDKEHHSTKLGQCRNRKLNTFKVSSKYTASGHNNPFKRFTKNSKRQKNVLSLHKT